MKEIFLNGYMCCGVGFAIALQATKRWLNELDGSLDDERFDLPAIQSSSSLGEETERLLRQLWEK